MSQIQLKTFFTICFTFHFVKFKKKKVISITLLEARSMVVFWIRLDILHRIPDTQIPFFCDNYTLVDYYDSMIRGKDFHSQEM